MVFATRLFLHQEKRHLSPAMAVKEFLGSFMTEFPFENTFDQLLARYTVSSRQTVWEESEVVLQESDICRAKQKRWKGPRTSGNHTVYFVASRVWR